MTASQIIKTAEAKADVRDTNFIPYNDKLNILNDCYKQMYQESINVGEQFFLKSIVLSDGQKLPDDFYTVREVLDTGPFRPDIIPRMNASTQFGYDLVNDRFILKGFTTAKVVYNPKPIYLTFPGKNVPTKISSSENVVAYYKNIYAVYSEGMLSVVDSENNQITSFQLPTENFVLSDTALRPDYIMVRNAVPDGDVYTDVLDYDGNLVNRYDNSYILHGIDDCFILVPEGTGYDILNVEDRAIGHTENLPQLYSEYTNTLYFVLEDGIYKDEDGELVKIGENPSQDEHIGLLHYDDAEFIYYNLSTRPEVISDQGITSIRKEGYGCIYGNNDYLAVRNHVWTHFSPVPDTDVSWPNNAYYTYLSALVALEFIKRLEGNVDSINLDVEEERFYKTIKRDNSQYIVMKDFGYF